MKKSIKLTLLICGIVLLVAVAMYYYFWQKDMSLFKGEKCGYWNNYCHPESDGPYDSF